MDFLQVPRIRNGTKVAYPAAELRERGAALIEHNVEWKR
jgi:hypothetical protein